jgi:hypothetical protein
MSLPKTPKIHRASDPAAENLNQQQASREVKGRTHTYYQVLIDARDCPYIVKKINAGNRVLH